MRVEFYLIDAMEVLHFGPVLEALLKMGVDAEFVSCRGRSNVVGNWYDADNAEALMSNLRLPYSNVANRNADIALTTQETWRLRGYRKLRARMNYGPMLTSRFIDSAPSINPKAHAGFDLYLVHGPFNFRVATHFVRADQVRMVGYPRFDAWFNCPPDPRKIRRRLGISETKPVILYLPTWEHRSSIDDFADSMFALADRFEILVKPHHCTYRMEAERMRKLGSGPVRIVAPTVPPEEPYTIADVVIVDASSGTLAETILLKKKTIGIAAKGELDQLLLPALRDQIPFCLSPRELPQLVNKVCAAAWPSAGILELRKELFDTSEGRDGERAAQAIVEFVEVQKHQAWFAAKTQANWQIRRLAAIQHSVFVQRISHPVRTLKNGARRLSGGGNGRLTGGKHTQSANDTSTLPILMYHNVGPTPAEDPEHLTVPPEQFERQMRWLVKRGYETILPSDWLEARSGRRPLPRKPVMLTFDDGYADVVEYAFPVLRRLGLKAAVFVVTQRLGHTNTWDETEGHPAARLMTEQQVRDWAQQGIEFGSHTRTHPHLTQVSEQELAAEIEGSREDLQRLLDAEVLSFAYPFGEGAESSVVRGHVRSSYRIGLTVCAGTNTLETSPYEARRVSVLPHDSFLNFVSKLRFGKGLRHLACERVPRPVLMIGRLASSALRTR